MQNEYKRGSFATDELKAMRVGACTATIKEAMRVSDRLLAGIDCDNFKEAIAIRAKQLCETLDKALSISSGIYARVGGNPADEYLVVMKDASQDAAAE